MDTNLFLYKNVNSCQKKCLLQIFHVLGKGIQLEDGFFVFFLSMYCIQLCFICRPSDSTVSEDAGLLRLGIVSQTLTRLNLTRRYEYTVKKVNDFPVPSRDVTNQTLPGRE